MKTVNLFALGQLNFEDFGGFLSWLANIVAAEVNVSQILKNPPIRSSKINPVLKVLEQFAMISNRKGCISITRAGREFVNADAAKRRSIVREPLLSVESICRVQELLKSSPTGRLQKHTIHDSLNLGSSGPAQDSEVMALISWGEACELFQYDKKTEEIMMVATGQPSGPDKGPLQPGSNVRGLSMAS
jgi:hypothetical protein